MAQPPSLELPDRNWARRRESRSWQCLCGSWESFLLTSPRLPTHLLTWFCTVYGTRLHTLQAWQDLEQSTFFTDEQKKKKQGNIEG